MHKSLNEFKFWPDTTTTYDVVNTLAPSFLIGSSFLQVTRITIKSRMSLKFGQIQSWTTELAALDHHGNISV